MENIDTTICTELNASHVLAEALKQMDEIINGSERSSRCEIITEKIADYTSNVSSSQDISVLLKNFKLSIEKLENTHDDAKRTNYDNLDKDTCLFIMEWLKKKLLSPVKEVTAAEERGSSEGIHIEDGIHECMWA